MQHNLTEIYYTKGEDTYYMYSTKAWQYSEPTAKDYTSIVANQDGEVDKFTVYYNNIPVCGYYA